MKRVEGDTPNPDWHKTTFTCEKTGISLVVYERNDGQGVEYQIYEDGVNDGVIIPEKVFEIVLKLLQ